MTHTAGCRVKGYRTRAERQKMLQARDVKKLESLPADEFDRTRIGRQRRLKERAAVARS